MSPRTLAFVCAAVMLVVVRFAMLVKSKREQRSPTCEKRTAVIWSPWQLVLASFLTLFAELAFIRDCGYAVDDEENELTIRCVAAPVFDAARQPFGGVSVSTVTFAVSREKLESFVPDLIGTADRVSRSLSATA